MRRLERGAGRTVGAGDTVPNSGSRRPAIPGLVLGRARGRGSHPRTRAALGLRPGTQRSPARSWLTEACSILRVYGGRSRPKGRTGAGTRRQTGPGHESAARRRKENAAAERREARRPAIRPSSPAIRRWVRPRGGPRVRRFRTSACRRSAPFIFLGSRNRQRGTRPLLNGPAEHWLLARPPPEIQKHRQ